MDLDDLSIAGGAEAHAVILNAEFGANGVESLTDFAASFGIGVIEEADGGAPDELTSRPKNVGGDDDGDQGVEGLPVRKHDKAEADDDAEAGETVREDVLAVGLEDEGIGSMAGAEQIVAEAGIEDARGENQENAIA